MSCCCDANGASALGERADDKGRGPDNEESDNEDGKDEENEEDEEDEEEDEEDDEEDDEDDEVACSAATLRTN